MGLISAKDYLKKKGSPSGSDANSSTGGLVSAKDYMKKRNTDKYGSNDQHMASSMARQSAEKQQLLNTNSARADRMMSVADSANLRSQIDEENKPLYKKALDGVRKFSDKSGITKDLGYLGDAAGTVFNAPGDLIRLGTKFGKDTADAALQNEGFKKVLSSMPTFGAGDKPLFADGRPIGEHLLKLRQQTDIPGVTTGPAANFIRGLGDTFDFGTGRALDEAFGNTDYLAGRDTKAAKAGEIAGIALPFAGLGVGLAKKGINLGLESLKTATAEGKSKQIRAIIDAMNSENPTLALPAPRERGNANSAMAADVIPVPETGPRALPAPDMLPPTVGRIEKQTNPYLTKLENLFDTARKMDLPPGREYEYLHDLWSRMAGREDPGLDELINLASQTRPNKLAPDLMQRARTAQGKRDVYGVPLPVKTLSERYNGGVVSPAAMPETKLMRLPSEEQLANARKGLTRTEPAVKSNAETAAAAEETPLVAKGIETFDPSLHKDISGFSAQTRDFYRNMEKALGDQSKPYIDAFNTAKKGNIDTQEYWLNELKKNVVDKLGIGKGSKLSALTQKFGEKQITLDELKQQAPKDWEKVVEADKWFRESYDHLIDIVNESRTKVYPGNPEKIVPKQSDYYRHFRELNGLEGFKNLFDTPAGIDPSLAGISEFTKPKSKFASIFQKRGLGPFKNDAVGGFLNYIPAASYAVHIDPQISHIRSLASALADTTKDSKNLNHFIEYLHDFANDLSGKTNPADRFVQKIIPGGRKTMAAVTWLSNRVKSNVILGNLRSTLAQTANIPAGIAEAKQYSVQGVGRTMASIFKESEAMKQSGFLKERYVGRMYRKFDTNWLSLSNPLHTKKFAEWMMETTDKLGTNFVWNSVHAKGVAQKVADPIAYADDITRKLIAGRGIGEVPLLQKARVTQLVMPFQLEVANLWRVMGDFVRKKDFGALATLFVANYLFNRGMEKVTGSGVTFDPIQAMIEAFGTPDLTAQERGGRLAGEVFSNMPGGQALAGSVFPEYGGSVFGVKVPTRKKLFGDNDPTRFGSAIPLFKAFSDPLHTVATGFGGNQIKKISQAIDTIKKGGSYTKDDTLKFPVKGSLAKSAQMLLFGPNSTQEAQDYYKNDRRPLSAKETAAYQNSPNKDLVYKGILKQRDLAKIEKKVTDIEKDKSLTDAQKIAKIQPLMVKWRKEAGG